MALFLRQSTASQEVPLGPFVDSTDGITPKTALTINNTDIKLWKSGATSLTSKNSGGATHLSNGIYYAVLDATDTNTIGPLKAFVNVSGSLAVILECVVLDEAVYDSVFGTESLVPDNASIAEILTDTSALGGARVVVTSVNYGDGSNVLLLRGDDYYNTDSRSFEWVNAAGTWPDLTGATITLSLNAGASLYAGSVVTPTGANQKVRVELSSAQTTALARGNNFYRLYAVLSNTHHVTLARGEFHIE